MAANKPGRPRSAPHGSTARWRGTFEPGCRCDECRRAHLDAQAVRYRERGFALWEPLAPQLFALVASGVPYGEACAELGVTVQAVTAHRHRDPDFADRFDAALMAGRDPGLAHGAAAAWKDGCRCPECREYHEQSR